MWVQWSAALNSFVAMINRISTGCQPIVVFLCFSIGLHKGFDCLCFKRVVQATCLRCPREYEGRLSPGRTVLSAFSSARCHLAALPCAPTRLASDTSEFLTDRSIYMRVSLFALAKRRLDLWFSMLWGARETVLSRANRPVGVRPLCFEPPRTALPWYVSVVDSTRQFT